jgi:hypothetical protein
MAITVLRFVTGSRRLPFGLRGGVFTIAYELRRKLPVDTPRLDELTEQLSWFEANLAIPSRFSRSRHPRAQESAISWIKSEAGEHVRRLRLLAALVEALGNVPIEEVRTERPGYVVFEDAHQVVALPFADTLR